MLETSRLAKANVLPTTWQQPLQTKNTYICGVTIPMHGQGYRFTSLTLWNEYEGIETEQTTEPDLPLILYFCNSYHANVMRLFSNLISGHTPLSKREEEVIYWAAKGKTTWETSIILSISERTINQYVKNACMKLGASNKQHAVAKAVYEGAVLL